MNSSSPEYPILISVVVPYYNAEDCLERLFLSLADYADRRDVEMIIVDDHSEATHGQALDRAAEHRHWSNLTIIHASKNGGAAKARKIGIEVAKGEFIAFLDSDDAWALNKLDAQVAAMQQANALISGCACEQIDVSELAHQRETPVATYSFVHYRPLKALFSNPYSTPTVVLKRSAALANPFSDTLRYSEDVDCWRRVVLQHGGIIVNQPNAFMFKHAFLSNQGSLSSFTMRMTMGQLSSLFKLIFNSKIALGYRCLIPLALVWAVAKGLRREWIAFRSRA